MTAFGVKKPPNTRPRAISPELAESVKSETPEPAEVEMRKVVSMTCHCRRSPEHQDTTVRAIRRY